MSDVEARTVYHTVVRVGDRELGGSVLRSGSRAGSMRRIRQGLARSFRQSNWR